MDNVAVVVVVLIVVVVVVVNCCANVAQLRLLDIPVFCLVFKTKSLHNQTHIHILYLILTQPHSLVLLHTLPHTFSPSRTTRSPIPSLIYSLLSQTLTHTFMRSYSLCSYASLRT